MASKAVEAKGAMRLPKQYVREGRGVAGYTGNVETYDVKRERKAPVVANAAGDIKPAPAEKLEASKLTRDSLESMALQRGIAQDKIDGAMTKQDLVDLIEAAGP